MKVIFIIAVSLVILAETGDLQIATEKLEAFRKRLQEKYAAKEQEFAEKQHIKALKGGDDMKRDGTAYYPVLESEIILRKISKKRYLPAFRLAGKHIYTETEWKPAFFVG